MKPEISLVIPAYNEARRIGPSVVEFDKYLGASGRTYEIIVVDDGSSDGTYDAVQELLRPHPRVRLIRNFVHQGRGHAARTGVLASRGRLCALADASLSIPAQEFGAALKITGEGHDLVVATYAQQDSVIGRQFGFKLLRGRAARDIFKRCLIDGDRFELEALFLARRCGYSIREMPVNQALPEGLPAPHWLLITLTKMRLRLWWAMGKYKSD